MKTILFPTDFSEVAKNAFVYALNFAKQYNSKIIVLHQYQLPIVHSDALPLSIKEVYDSIEFQNFENFKSHVPKLKQIAQDHNMSDINLQYVMTQGELISNIQEIVNKESVDVIIMGTQGASGLKEIFLGSNAGNIIANVDCLIISVPHMAVFKGFNHIMFSTRFREKDKAALKKLILIAQNFDATIHIVNVTQNISKANELLAEWQTLFNENFVKFYVLESQQVIKTLIHFTTSHAIDLMAMLHYKKSFLQELFNTSYTQKMSNHAQIPLLSINELNLD